MEIIDIVKVFVPATVAFVSGILITPLLTHYLYKYKVWKRVPGKHALDGTDAKEFNQLHREGEGRTPRMGGVVIWVSSILTILGIWLFASLTTSATFDKLDFFSRSQTWLPLFMLVMGGIVGLVSDALDIWKGGKGLSLTHRIAIVSGMALFVSWWFFAKLEITSIGVPGGGEFDLGIFFIPFFMLVALALYAGGIIDGIDGLSGGVFASIFAAYSGIAFYQEQIDLAAFSAMVVGAILAFLWFNIPPARFYMTETGTMGLTLALAVIAFMTDTLGDGVGVAVLPIIAFPLVVTVASNIFQVVSKRFRGKKLFRVAPLHHHFEALGWPGYKVTMRYWVISVVCALVGIILALVS